MKKVIIIGHVDHGKTTLTSAIKKALENEDVQIVASRQDIKNQMADDYLKIKPIDVLLTQTEIYDKPKSKFHK